MQIQDPSQVVAKLADYGLLRAQTGRLKLGLETWRWLAPEVLDFRKASTFTEKADIFSFGVVFWEVLNGAGINPPYFESEARYRSQPDLIAAIREGSLRPTMTDYARSLFRYDHRFTEVEDLIQACLHHSPEYRPSARELVYKLRLLLDLPAEEQPPEPPRRLDTVSPVELLRAESFDLRRIPRSPHWTCACGEFNTTSVQIYEAECTKCERPRPDGSVRSMCVDAESGGLWIGLNTGVVVAVAVPPLVLGFPEAELVLSIEANNGSLWAVTPTKLMFLKNRSVKRPKLIDLDPELGFVIGVFALGSQPGVQLLQVKAEANISHITRFQRGAKPVKSSINGLIRAACSSGLKFALAMTDEVRILHDGLELASFPYAHSRFVARRIQFDGDELVLADR